jgi:hypothetical protein
MTLRDTKCLLLGREDGRLSAPYDAITAGMLCSGPCSRTAGVLRLRRPNRGPDLVIVNLLTQPATSIHLNAGIEPQNPLGTRYCHEVVIVAPRRKTPYIDTAPTAG